MRPKGENISGVFGIQENGLVAVIPEFPARLLHVESTESGQASGANSGTESGLATNGKSISEISAVAR
jgi:hypothetical protein